MNLKNISSLLLVSILLISSLSMVAIYSPAGNTQPNVHPYGPSPFALGSVVILPDGSVSGSASSVISHAAGSNYYNLTENLMGNLTILNNNTAFNGNGYGIYNFTSGSEYNVVTITNSSGVSFKNTGIFTDQMVNLAFANTSYDVFSNLSMNTTYVAITLASNTSHISLSNTVIYDNLSSGASNPAIVSGGTVSTQATNGSSNNITFNNITLQDNLTNQSPGAPPSILIGSSYTSFVNSSVVLIGQAGVGVTLIGNYSDISNNNIQLMENGIGIIDGITGLFGPGSLPVKGNTVSNNQIYMHNSTESTIFFFNTGIVADGSGTITHNFITGNDTTSNVGVAQYGPNSTISHNFVLLNSTAETLGVYVLNNNTSVLNNSFSMRGSQAYGADFYSPSNSNLNNVDVKSNLFDLTGQTLSDGITGFGVTTPNLTIASNTLYMEGTSGAGIAVSGSSTNIVSNFVNMNSTNNIGTSSQGIWFGQTGYSNDVNISSNSVAVTAVNSSETLLVTNTNHSVISNNVFGQIQSNSNGSSLLTMVSVNDSTVNGNILRSTGSFSAYAATMDFSQNNTFYNNDFQGAVGLFNFTHSGNNLFYHNNFLYYENYGNSSNSSGILLNASYPVGGNYWENSISTLTDTHSGVNQNLPGSDGIGDSPVTTVAGTDNYPLMYQWNNPTVTFKESGLPANVAWTFVFNGHSYSTSSQSMTLNIVNGTYQNYSYSAQGTSLYYVQNENGSFAYSGSSASLTFNYVHWAYLSGSVYPSLYKLYLNGNLTVYNATSFNITIKAGTYELEIMAPGYSTYYENFTIAANQTQRINVNFTTLHPSSGGIPTQYLYYIAGGVGAVIVVGAVAFALRRKNIGK